MKIKDTQVFKYLTPLFRYVINICFGECDIMITKEK